jgi:hypothetical protein
MALEHSDTFVRFCLIILKTFKSYAKSALHTQCVYNFSLEGLFQKCLVPIHIVTCRVVRVTRMTASSSDDWVY